MKTVGITGGSGFIGTYVAEELEQRGYEVFLFDHARHDTPRRVYLGDIRDDVAVTEFVAHVDGVIHLAGVLGTQETIRNPIPAAHTNILGGLNVLQACAQYAVPMVYIGVGNHWMLNPYSLTKTTVEKFCEMFRKERGLPVTIVRAMNAYGPRQSVAAPYGSSKVRKIIPSFACRALSGDPIEVYGDGESVMDMIYVGDVAEVLVTALEHTAAEGAVETVLEAGTGRRTTVNEIADAVIESANGWTGESAELIHLPMRPGEDTHSVVLGDPSTLKAIGMDGGSFTPLEQGVAMAVDYFADYLGIAEEAAA